MELKLDLRISRDSLGDWGGDLGEPSWYHSNDRTIENLSTLLERMIETITLQEGQIAALTQRCTTLEKEVITLRTNALTTIGSMR